jgi:hypothetical protein
VLRHGFLSIFLRSGPNLSILDVTATEATRLLDEIGQSFPTTGPHIDAMQFPTKNVVILASPVASGCWGDVFGVDL